MAELTGRYVERAARLSPLEVRVLREGRAAESEKRKAEDMATLKESARGGVAVLVTERGKAWSSTRLATWLDGRLAHAGDPTYFLLGGELGFRPQDEGWARESLKLSDFTLPHELARAVLAEQVYRALTIVRRVKYHK